MPTGILKFGHFKHSSSTTIKFCTYFFSRRKKLKKSLWGKNAKWMHCASHYNYTAHVRYAFECGCVVPFTAQGCTWPRPAFSQVYSKQLFHKVPNLCFWRLDWVLFFAMLFEAAQCNSCVDRLNLKLASAELARVCLEILKLLTRYFAVSEIWILEF